MSGYANEDLVRRMARSCLGKKRYRTEAFAKKVVKYVRETRGTDLRIYPCSICQGFHLTKQPKEPPREIPPSR